MTLAKAKENLDTKNTLPYGWNWVLLEDLFDVKQGAAMSPVRRQGIAPRPFLRTLNVLWGSVDLSNLDKMDFAEDEVASLNLRSGDLLVCEGGDVGRTAIWRGELDSCLYQNHIHRLRRRHNNVAPEFYAYWMQAAFKVFQSYKGKEITTTIPNLSGGKLKSFMVPFPPTLAEQERIAHILNEQMTAVQQARTAAEARLEAAMALPAAYLGQVLPQPGQELPNGWQWVRLKDVCDVVNGFGFPEHLQGRTDLPYPFIKVSDMNAPGAERVVTSAANTVNQEVLKLIGGRVYPCGTVIFPKVGGALLTNKKRILGTTACFDNNVMGVVPKKVASDYVFYWFQTIDLRTLANVQALPSVKQSSVAALELPLPPLAEQKRIAAMLNERMGAVGEIVQTIQQELDAIKGLPAAFLRRAFTGGL